MRTVSHDRWEFEERQAPLGRLVAEWPATVAMPQVHRVARCRPLRPGIVLGSTQPSTLVDIGEAARDGFDMAQRRSGGGAVWVAADDPLWIDLWLPAGDPQWSDDVHAASVWCGSVWRRALDGLGLGGLAVHDGGLRALAPSAPFACFGSLGAGELVTAAGEKVVGVAQRRTRAGAWFTTALYRTWDPAPLLAAGSQASDGAGVSELRAAVTDLTRLSLVAGRALPSWGDVVEALRHALTASPTPH